MIPSHHKTLPIVQNSTEFWQFCRILGILLEFLQRMRSCGMVLASIGNSAQNND